jgi:hypothetical protein
MFDDHYLHTANDSKSGIPTVFRNQKDFLAFSRALRAAVLLLFGMDVLPWISQMGSYLGTTICEVLPHIGRMEICIV